MISLPTTSKQLISYSKGGIVSKVLQKSDHGDVTLFCMAKDTKISEHTASRNALIYVLEGKGVFYMSDKTIEMQQGLLIRFAAQTKHHLEASENLSFLLFLSS